MRYNVHFYCVVRAMVANVEADTQIEAITKAEESVDFDLLFNDKSGRAGAHHTEYAEEIVEYLVDEMGDDEFERSHFYGPDLQPTKGVLNQTLYQFVHQIAATPMPTDHTPAHDQLAAWICNARAILGAFRQEAANG